MVKMTTREKIVSQIETIAKQQEKQIAALDDNLVLTDSGLDSLCFALLVANLEDKLGYDPFTASDDVNFPVTFGDFVRLYEDGAH
ncbi:Phosphopantetheine attachment site [Bauldia litoralis]|uniref:Phosphopantetheine attachment site n=2 Tax=Bauldia litoralis TaxID=665467 RepID=A0A1G6DV03_9HYPH|nr:Phosphopantetheine attachment site [Bauldia litoralis]